VKYFLWLLLACAVSVVLYVMVFGFVVSRPLVIDQVRDFMAKKLAYADATGHPKIFVVAGSNARFSHSCAVLEQALRRPCVNMGIAADVSLDWTLDNVRQRLAAKDLVYLPIEYGVYSRSKVQMMTGMDAAYRFRHDKASLATRGAEGVTRAAFMFSLPTLVQSIGEMGLNAVGVRRRFNIDTLDRQGDEIGHGGDKTRPYPGVIRGTHAILPGITLLDHPDGAQAAIIRFLDFCRTRGVTAVGGLPTVSDDMPVPEFDIQRLQNFYTRHGARFVLMPNRSQYPRADFYDTDYHLRQSAQERHSRMLANALRPLLSR
jgi:hypothetical protein